MPTIRDLAVGEVLTAPSPATSGTTLVLKSGQGADMPTDLPFKLLVYPPSGIPTKTTAEKVLVTARSTDTLTIVRAQGETTAKSIAAGWYVANAIFTEDIYNTSLISNEVPSGSVNGVNTTFTTASAYTPNSLRVFKNGIRLKKTEDYTETTSGFTLLTAPATGTILLVDYSVGNTANSVGTNSLVTHETPVGLVDGSNTAFTTARAYIAGSLEVFVNGLRQAGTTHVTETNPSLGTFSLDVAPSTGDIVRVAYQYNLNPSSNADTVDGYHGDDLMPVGATIPYAGINAPSANWLFCYGQAVSRTGYPTLYNRLGTTYGVGDGSTTFNLPDLRGRVPAGQDDMGGSSANRLTNPAATLGGIDGDVLGGTGGSETHTLTENQMPTHDHDTGIDFGSAAGGSYQALDRVGGAANDKRTGFTGGGFPHNNVQPTLILNYIIKAL